VRARLREPDHTPRPRSDGLRTRATILRAATRLASVVGLEGLSIGALAEHLGVSKSGVFAHFRAKEELQLATVAAAEEIFAEEVIQPALAEASGLPRLRALAARFFAHVEARTFPGGCFFAAAAAELDARTGPVRNRVADFMTRWAGTLLAEAKEARRRGQLAAGVEPDAFAFELGALLNHSNDTFMLSGDARALGRGREAIARMLARVEKRATRPRRR
jgi:AcrR family transcriptional regulator